MVGLLRRVELVDPSETAETLELAIVPFLLGGASCLIELDQLAEVVGRVTRQLAGLCEAERHPGREIALAVHHELQVVGRAKAGLLRKRAQGVSSLPLFAP